MDEDTLKRRAEIVAQEHDYPLSLANRTVATQTSPQNN